MPSRRSRGSTATAAAVEDDGAAASATGDASAASGAASGGRRASLRTRGKAINYNENALSQTVGLDDEVLSPSKGRGRGSPSKEKENMGASAAGAKKGKKSPKKRKRNPANDTDADSNDDGSVYAPDSDDGDDNDDEEEASDWADDKPARKRTKRAAASSRKRGGSKATAALVEGSLLHQVLADRVACKVTVKAWLAEYKTDADAAKADLFNMILAGAGASVDDQVTAEALDDLTTVVEDVMENTRTAFNESNATGYPLDPDAKKSKAKTSRFGDFWQMLVRESAAMVLDNDDDLLDTIVHWTLAVSSSAFRPFRYVATLVGINVTMGVVSLAAEKATQAEADRRRLEQARAGNRKNAKRISMIEKPLRANMAALERLDTIIDQLFNGIFVHRYRDADDTIRNISLRALGDWTAAYPQLFLRDSYTKYVAWQLNDADADVRKTALSIFQALFSSEDNVGALTEFLKRFKGRLIEMAYDTSDRVALEAIKLATSLVEKELLEQDDINAIYCFLSSGSAKLRAAAAAFVQIHLFDQVVKRQIDDADFAHQTEMELNGLIKFIVDYSLQADAPEYIVDSFFDSAACLTDWTTMVEMLGGESEDDDLTDEYRAMLAEVMYLAVRRCVGDDIVPAQSKAIHVLKHGRRVSKAKKSKSRKRKDKAEAELQRVEAMQAAVLPALATLLTRVQSEPFAVWVVRMLAKFDPSTLTARQCADLVKACKKLPAMMFMKTDNEFFSAVAETLEVLGTPESPAQPEIITIATKVMDSVSTKAIRAIEESSEGIADATEEKRYALAVALGRLRAFAEFADLSGYALFEPVHELVAALSDAAIDADAGARLEPLLVPGIVTLTSFVANRVLSGIESQASGSLDEAEGNQIVAEVETLATLLSALIVCDADAVAMSAYHGLVDVFVFASRANPAPFSFSSPEIHDQLASFVKSEFEVLDDMMQLPETELSNDDLADRLFETKRVFADFCRLVSQGLIDPVKHAHVAVAYLTDFEGEFAEDAGAVISALSPVIDIARVYADALWLRFKLAVKSNETLEQAMDLASALASRTSGRDSTAAVATIITETFGRAFAADETDPDMEVDDGVGPKRVGVLTVLAPFVKKLSKRSADLTYEWILTQHGDDAERSFKPYRTVLGLVARKAGRKAKTPSGSARKSRRAIPVDTPASSRSIDSAADPQSEVDDGEEGSGWISRSPKRKDKTKKRGSPSGFSEPSPKRAKHDRTSLTAAEEEEGGEDQAANSDDEWLDRPVARRPGRSGR